MKLSAALLSISDKTCLSIFMTTSPYALGDLTRFREAKSSVGPRSRVQRFSAWHSTADSQEGKHSCDARLVESSRIMVLFTLTIAPLYDQCQRFERLKTVSAKHRLNIVTYVTDFIENVFKCKKNTEVCASFLAVSRCFYSVTPSRDTALQFGP